MLLKTGDKNGHVKTLQHRLNHLGYHVESTGEFNVETLQAVVKLQKDKGLVVDGLVGNKTMSALLQRNVSHLLKQEDIHNAAKLLDVDLASIFAIKNVESRGNGFLPDGRVVILYERHIMRKRLKANGFNADQIAGRENRFPNIVNRKTGGYGGGATEHYRLNLACNIHMDSAYESCSWGLFQIMGFHWERLGYASVDDYVSAMRANEGNQLHAFCQFIKTDKKLHQALKDKNWAAFARIYNGPGYKKNRYDQKMQAEYDKYQDLEGAPWD